MRIAVGTLFIAAILWLGGSLGTSIRIARNDLEPAAIDLLNTPSPSPTPSITRPVSEPYTGPLDIFEDPDRPQKLKIDRVMDVLGLAPGKAVADIGAGSGWFTVRASRRVGERGSVFAVEINPEYIKHIEARAKTENLSNIRTILGKPDDPMLPEKAVDAVLILKTYHEIEQPIVLMTRLRRSLRDRALVGIIDRNGSGGDHGIDRKMVIDEMSKAGFRLKEEHDFVVGDGMDYFLVFEVK